MRLADPLTDLLPCKLQFVGEAARRLVCDACEITLKSVLQGQRQAESLLNICSVGGRELIVFRRLWVTTGQRAVPVAKLPEVNRSCHCFTPAIFLCWSIYNAPR